MLTLYLLAALTATLAGASKFRKCYLREPSLTLMTRTTSNPSNTVLHNRQPNTPL